MVIKNIRDIFIRPDMENKIDLYLDKYLNAAPADGIREGQILTRRKEEADIGIKNLLLSVEKGLSFDNVVAVSKNWKNYQKIFKKMKSGKLKSGMDLME